MNLYLVRHGKAKPEEEDEKRPLSDTGVADVKTVADYIRRYWNVSLSHIFHSTKLRAKQTAEIIADMLKNETIMEEVEALQPLDDVRVWGDRIGTMDNDVMLVGHLPYMGKLASYLLVDDPNASTVVFQTASVLHLKRSEEGGWSVIRMVDPLIARRGDTDG